jgi:hypothetical protein
VGTEHTAGAGIKGVCEVHIEHVVTVLMWGGGGI